MLISMRNCNVSGKTVISQVFVSEGSETDWKPKFRRLRSEDFNGIGSASSDALVKFTRAAMDCTSCWLWADDEDVQNVVG